MSDSTAMMDERLRDEASKAGREALEAALQRFSREEREAFWNAIGLYYSGRRHPGAGERPAESVAVVAA
ncbi:hypothetical protein [Methylobacterium organophilum]|uniref:Uncharacterized protein n=1 Tax=Methylobacterium organophilum TaxID=410 RepID=A0ABQ4T584_METOR|nr:hypothetical protein [Methylobacterium organophilum]UMY17161.1 hypothetical protein MMB17_21345 [Methylobacterium organophilum]GJE26817.1 hypothetical protein LKMONMHP_1671 [Methylobacterium organophilum]